MADVAPIVQILDAPVLQKGIQLLEIFDRARGHLEVRGLAGAHRARGHLEVRGLAGAHRAGYRRAQDLGCGADRRNSWTWRSSRFSPKTEYAAAYCGAVR